MLKFTLFLLAAAAFAPIVVRGASTAADVRCFVGRVTQQDSTTLRVRAVGPPQRSSDSVFVAPHHPFVLVCSDFQRLTPYDSTTGQP